MPELSFGHFHHTWLHPFVTLTGLSEVSVVTIFIALIIATAAFFGTRGLRHNNISRKQALWELIGQGFVNFVESIMGPHSRRYVPLIGTLFIFILTMNMFGLIPGFISPTASLNTTVALALSVFVVVQYEGIRSHGFKSYLMHFVGEPWALGILMFPLHVIGELAKPLSLSLRLAGNIFAEDAVLIILGALSPVLYMFLKQQWAQDVPFFPLQFLILPLIILFGIIQALVFSMLSAIYITVMVGESHEEAPSH